MPGISHASRAGFHTASGSGTECSSHVLPHDEAGADGGDGLGASQQRGANLSRMQTCRQRIDEPLRRLPTDLGIDGPDRAQREADRAQRSQDRAELEQEAQERAAAQAEKERLLLEKQAEHAAVAADSTAATAQEEKARALQEKRAAHAAAGHKASGKRELRAAMPGIVVAVKAKEGDVVEEGQTLVVLEAMKMEHVLRAPRAGRVAAIACAAGDRVQEGVELVQLEDDVAPATDQQSE